jgi:predicted lipoprotein with Yx(FWY)xxD motif
MLKILATTAFALALAAGTAFAAEPASPAPVAQNGMFVTAKGMTLYTFDKDTAGKSACTGSCATNWPPHAAAASDKESGDFTHVTREDGGKQWAHKGKPLYTFAKDEKPGDAGGGAIPNWKVAKP